MVVHGTSLGKPANLESLAGEDLAQVALQYVAHQYFRYGSGSN